LNPVQLVGFGPLVLPTASLPFVFGRQCAADGLPVAAVVRTEQSQDRAFRGRFSGEVGTAVGVDGFPGSFCRRASPGL
jgi:hypothetical protein